ncbi:uncharacterized protein CcaverHIS019_0606310 [Cutaneotrichosporon cavernicola]|uniref:Centrosomin N-terminal motif 1 domain-containing protein n=1 Tax=Cutaneotrichosporon cavernicola TaxID=279322 RepID=A0AA48QY65_9TREE|nr:uncharacterized protein CcaverHIS019_0606310 [Cutaneotrichosporon cavernicola]BEI94172.1 hypothetical protein CcaverHIS019_0606310 [Cutaneotrichosporon cavernicola]
MPPSSGLEGVLNSSIASNGSTAIPQSTTLPDISLGSLGSSFHSFDEDSFSATPRKPISPSRTPNSDRFDRHGGGLYTPAAAAGPATALLASPPPSTLPTAGRARQRGGDSSEEDGDDALDARYGSVGEGSEDDGVLNNLSLNVSHRRDVRKSKAGGRHSVAAGPSNQMTLREQEQNVDALQKENFNLQLENHFLKERLASMAPDNLESVVSENVKLRVEILTIAKELKKCKKLLLQQDRDLAATARERDDKGRRRERDAEAREMEGMWREEKEKRQAVEDELAKAREEHEDKVREIQYDLDELRGQVDDQLEEMSRLRDTADIAQDELEKVREEARGLTDSVGLGRGRESRTIAKLEADIAELKADLEIAQKRSGGDVEAFEDRINEWRDKHDAAQIELERRDQEIEELNNEIDAKIAEHERELNAVENEWRDELLVARSQADELKDVMAERELELDDFRKLLMERDDDIMGARDRIAELEAARGETAERLTETLRGIEMDNATKEEDIVAANHEVDRLGQRVYELEETIEALQAREADLEAELNRADEDKAHFEELIDALKTARKKANDEREEIASALKRESDARAQDADHHRRAVAGRDQAQERVTAELEAARDRVAMRDRDLMNVQTALRSLEDERRKIGAAANSDQHSLELEIERLRRDLGACEDDLDRARDEVREKEQTLHDRDMELAELIDKTRDLEGHLSNERQGRLNVSEKLDAMTKTAKQHEREVSTLRERLEELEPLLTETQNARMQVQKESERQKQERSDLLLRVFKDVNRFLGTEDNTTPHNFVQFRDTLLQRMRSINGARSDFDKRIKEVETGMEKNMTRLKRQLDAKWRALDGFEASVKKLELQRSQQRAKLAQKDGELDVARARISELQREANLARARGPSTPSGGADLQRALDRAERAERRAREALASIQALEKRLAEESERASGAEGKWEARVKEYESRLRIAGEKVKAEKQGGKERARQLEDQVRDLHTRIDHANVQNRRAEGVVANAAHLLDNNR